MEQFEGKPLTDGQKRFIRTALEANGGDVIYLGGEAGTGKSLAVHAVLASLEYRLPNFQDAVIMAAPTGVAAVPFGGITVWNLLGMVPGDEYKTPEEIWAKMDPERVKGKSSFKLNRLRRMRYLFIDEISMMSRQFWIKLDFMLRMARESTLPMGGAIVVCIGDFHQLPPVIKEQRGEDGQARKRQRTLDGAEVDAADGMLIHFPEFNDALTSVVILDENKRQAGDIPMIYCLQAIRRGPEAMDEYVWRCLNGLRTPLAYRQLPNPDLAVPQIFPLRRQVEETNRNYLRGLAGPLLIVTSQDLCPFNDPRHAWKRANYLKTIKSELARSVSVAEHVALRVGAVVMYLRNDKDRGLVNGSRGRITSIDWPETIRSKMDPEHPELDAKLSHGVQLEKGERLPAVWATFETDARTGETAELLVEPADFEVKYREDGGQTRYVRRQLPLHVGPATTVHKAQGQTFSVMRMEEMSGCFAAGQVYTSITRGTNFQGLELVGTFGPRAVLCDPRVSAWYRKHESPEAEARFQELKARAKAMGVFQPTMKPDHADWRPEGEIRSVANAEERERKRQRFAEANGEDPEEGARPVPNSVAVFGSHEFRNYETFATLMTSMRTSFASKGDPVVRLVHGDHPLGGVDAHVAHWAREAGLPAEQFRLQLKAPTLDSSSEDDESEEAPEPADIVKRRDYADLCRRRDANIIGAAKSVVLISIKDRPSAELDLVERAARAAGKTVYPYALNANWDAPAQAD